MKLQADDEARKIERRKCDERERLARIRRENADHKLVLEQRAREVRTSNHFVLPSVKTSMHRKSCTVHPDHIL
jgi:hypothetical protein